MAEARYLPFGQERWTGGAAVTDFGFTGQRNEAGFGLLDYNARFYDPGVGRFVSADTVVVDSVNPQSLNRYMYVWGNPLQYVDPTGHFSEEQLSEQLGEDWKEFYFGQNGIFADRDNLYQFLTSDNTTDSFTLDFVGQAFQTAKLMSYTGLSFVNIDAIGFSLRVSAGEAFYAGFAGEGILNLTSGEFSIFGAPGGGAIVGFEGSLTGGPFFIKNLPTNADYRNYFGSIGVIGGEGVALAGELFFGAPKAPQVEEGTHGVFIGAGPGGGLGIYGGYAFFFEALRVDASGYRWFPDPLNYRPQDIGPIIQNDIIGTLERVGGVIYDYYFPK